LTIGAVLFGGCASLKKIIQEPEVEFKGMSMRDMSLFQGTLVFDFAVTNPNAIGIPANNLTYNLKIDGQSFINGKLDKGIHLPAKSTEIVQIPVQIDYSSFFSSVADILQKDELEYDLTGSIGKYGMDIPFQSKGKIPVPKLPQISINRVDVESVSFKGASLVVVLDMINKNSFPVELKGLDYAIQLGGRKLAESKAEVVKNIGKNETSTLSVPVHLDFLQMGQAVYNLLSASQSAYELTGNMRFEIPGKGEKVFNYSSKGNVPIKTNQ